MKIFINITNLPFQFLQQHHHLWTSQSVVVQVVVELEKAAIQLAADRIFGFLVDVLQIKTHGFVAQQIQVAAEVIANVKKPNVKQFWVDGSYFVAINLAAAELRLVVSKPFGVNNFDPIWSQLQRDQTVQRDESCRVNEGNQVEVDWNSFKLRRSVENSLVDRANFVIVQIYFNQFAQSFEGIQIDFAYLIERQIDFHHSWTFVCEGRRKFGDLIEGQVDLGKLGTLLEAVFPQPSHHCIGSGKAAQMRSQSEQSWRQVGQRYRCRWKNFQILDTSVTSNFDRLIKFRNSFSGINCTRILEGWNTSDRGCGLKIRNLYKDCNKCDDKPVDGKRQFFNRIVSMEQLTSF